MSWPRSARVAVFVLTGFLLLGLAGFRVVPERPSSAIEVVFTLDADRTEPVDRLLGPLATAANGEVRWLGTDELGRSLATRLALALGTSLGVALTGALLAMVLGTAVGTTAALSGSRVDALLMRLTEATAGVPNVLVVLLLVAAFGKLGLWIVCAAMGLLFWQPVARVVRARALRLKAEPYVEASRALGASAWHRVRRHVLPGLWPTVLVQGSLLLPRLILLESLLSFLGVGIALHSFGRVIAGTSATLTPLSPTWWPVLIPCVVLALFVLSLNLVLDAAADTRS